MEECKICRDIEPEVHEESWWRCSCHKEKSKNLDNPLKFIEDNFEELWKGVNDV